MMNTTQSSFIHYVFNGAGIMFVVAVVLLVGYLAISWVRGGSQRRRLIGQEIVWTLVPALVVLGLLMVSEIPKGPGKAQDRLADGHAKIVSR